jgi:hypothetical protein
MPLRCLVLLSSLPFGVACDAEPEPVEDVRIRVTIVNTATAGSLTTSTGDAVDITLSPGIWAVHAPGPALFVPDQAATPGLEAMAETGMATQLMAEIQDFPGFVRQGTFGVDRPGENYEENPFAPGEQVSFDVHGTTADHLSLAMMFVHSNDVIVATPADGLPLDLSIDETRDVTDQIALWDAGTEVNEEPGAGPNQPMQGEGGEPENGLVAPVDDDNTWPTIDAFLSITLERTR